MTIETVPGTELKYFLISYNKKGVERSDDPDSAGGKLSTELENAIRNDNISDVFLISHGWKGDIPAAKKQYDDWTSAMVRCEQDIDAVKQARPDFKPIIVGLHWPSLPWGDEDQETEISFDASGGTPLDINDLVDDAAEKVCDTPAAREALKVIFTSALDDMEPATLPPEVSSAYATLISEMEITAAGPGGAPGDDGEELDPESMYQNSRDDEDFSFGGGSLVGGILSPLGQLSFWKMKKRAKKFGEKGAGELLRRLQNVTEDRDVRFHLMGHSFGCIAMSSCVAGRGGDQELPKPVNTVYLVQGAFSIWSYCDDIPVAPGKVGFFNSIAQASKVSGPILTTQSEHDTAVGKLYPLAAGMKGQVVYAANSPPKYGAVGSFGLRGPGIEIADLDMQEVGEAYEFKPGVIHNIESSRFICDGGGLSGAHSDISKKEVAHAFWQGILCTAGSS